MERFALLILSSAVVLFVVLGMVVGLRRKDSFWTDERKTPRRQTIARGRRGRDPSI